MAELIDIPEDVQQQLNDLLEAGRMLSAWTLAQPYGPLKHWPAGNPRKLAARIATATGNSRLGRVLDWLNWRHDRSNLDYYQRALSSRLRWTTPAMLLPEIRRTMAAAGTIDDEARGDLLLFEAWSLGTLRDFLTAHVLIGEALRLDAKSAWAHVHHSQVLEMEDRYEEALVAARKALELRPYYRPAVEQAADCLIHLSRDDEAIQLLGDAHAQQEHPAIALNLLNHYSEREDHAKALLYLGEYERLSPMLPEGTHQWLAGRRADFLYMAGDVDGYLEWCDRAGEGFHKTTAENLRRPGARERKRVRLDVPFVRQHNVTCAPATLAALAKYWGRDHAHLEIAEAICYDGTPWHKERAWVEANGFIAHEFRFTRECLIALIDRGIPFTLTTSGVTMAHLQACTGYDDRQDVVLLRDPTERHFGETLIDGLIKSHPLRGVRCMLVLPVEEAGRLEGVTLPDQELYAAYHQLSVAMENHDRWKAQEALTTMRVIAPDQPLTLNAEAEMAYYLGHRVKQLEFLDQLAVRFPDHQPLKLQRLRVLQALEDQESAYALLQSTVSKGGCHSIFVAEFGEMLLMDARKFPLAKHYLRRALRNAREDGSRYESLACWHDKVGNLDEAARLRRYSSTLSDKWEPYAREYFESCRRVGKTEGALKFLQHRVDQLGKLRPDPWLTHARALEALRRTGEVRTVLERALEKFPEDGHFLLQAGRMMLGWGDEDRARGSAWMDQARGKVSEQVWLRNKAAATIFEGDRTRTIRLWRKLLEHEPLAMDAYRALPRLISEEEGPVEATAFLEDAVRRHPRNPALLKLLTQWKGECDSELASLDRLVEMDPDDNWIWRRRATVRFEAGDREGGLTDAREALARDYRSPEAHGVLAELLHKKGEHEESMRMLREALHLKVDYAYAIEHLIAWSETQEAKEEAVRFIEAEMRRQVSTGECVPEYQTYAWHVIPRPALLARLQEFCRERPDLWQTWSARITQALRMDLQNEAAICARQLEESFPFLPRTWTEIARVRHAAGDLSGEVEALQKAVNLSPAWDWAARKLSEALERLGRYDEAQQVLEQAIHHDPLSCTNHGCLADLLLKNGHREEAWIRLEAAVKVEPFYSWGWTTLAGLSRALGREEAFCEKLRAQGESHGHNARWWEIAANSYDELDKPEKVMEAAKNGLQVDPVSMGLRDCMAQTLSRQGRYDEALAACEPVTADEKIPREILGRRAWILMEKGEAEAAIQAMKDLLDREPDYRWGWAEISGWYSRRQDWKNLSEAAAQWVRFNPDYAVAHGYVGLAARELGDTDLAKRALERAFLLDPEYRFAGRELLKLQTQGDDFTAAAATLETLRHYAPDIWVECDAVRLALRQHQDTAALGIAEKICEKAQSKAPLLHLNEEFTAHHMVSRWRKQLEGFIQQNEAAPPHVLNAWANLIAATKAALKAAVAQLGNFKITEEARDEAWGVLLRKAAGSEHVTLFENWISREAPRFRANGYLWNVVGELLVNIQKSSAAVSWLSTWETRREDTTSTTLTNLSAAWDAFKGPSHAAPIRAEGISLFSMEATYSMRVGQASHFASTGRIEEAAALLDPVDESSLNQYYTGIAGLAQSIVAASKGDENEARRYYRIALEKLSVWASHPDVGHHFFPAQKALARQLPWARKPRRLAKTWGSLPQDAARPADSTSKLALIVLAVLAIAGAIGCLAEGQYVGALLIGLFATALIRSSK